jgi:hypothetical protein
VTESYPRMTVDQVTGAIYVYLRPGTVTRTTDLLEQFDIYVDVDTDNRALGIEVLRVEIEEEI